MNKVYNESNEEITVVGEKYSHAYNKEVFNITLPKLIEKLWYNWNRGGLERHTDPDELYTIMNSCHVYGIEERKCLYQSAYFYFCKVKDRKITLREEFENEITQKNTGVGVLFETSNQHYIEWLECKIMF